MIQGGCYLRKEDSMGEIESRRDEVVSYNVRVAS